MKTPRLPLVALVAALSACGPADPAQSDASADVTDADAPDVDVPDADVADVADVLDADAPDVLDADVTDVDVVDVRDVPDAPEAAVRPEEQRSMRARDPAASEDLNAFALASTDFAVALHRAAAPESGNTVLSPHSVAVALAMARAGAVGVTGAELDAALRFTIPSARIHGAFNAIDLALAARPAQARAVDPEPTLDRPALLLRVVNDLWVQRGLALEAPFLDTLAASYGAGARVLDFIGASEAARMAINAWISQQTEQRIPQLIPRGQVTGSTRLVLTNAVYFNARWRERFNPDYTFDRPFQRDDGSTVSARMMSQSGVRAFRYGESPAWRAVDLPYVGDRLSMLVVMPTAGTLAAFERGLDGAALRAIDNALTVQMVSLSMPRFRTRLARMLRTPLQSLGVRAAFGPGADFSGITRALPLVISEVIHEGFIDVTEAGTEAAAATAVVFVDGGVGPQAVQLTVDRPFLYVVRDRPTGAVLFFGRVDDPTR